MKNAFSFFALAATILLMHIAPAAAQQARTFVSGSGIDSGNTTCSRTAPCRSFAQAISVTNAGGEIIALDSAGYGPFTITKSISVTAQGIEAAISVTSGDGITINAGANDVIDLRALTLTGAGGNNGIAFNSGGTLNIQKCVISGFANDGLRLDATTASTINVSDTIVANNSHYGINFGPHASSTASFERVHAINNLGSGFFVSDLNAPVSATVQAIAINSLASGNAANGFLAEAAYGGPVSFMIVNSEAVGNNLGGLYSVAASATGTLIVANTKVYSNVYGYNGGPIQTFGNNYFAGNDGNVGGLTPITQQ